MERLSRRTFTQSGALGLSALALAPGRAASANDRINVAVIGCRNRGPQVAEAMLATGEFNILAVCDCDTAMLDRGASKVEAASGTAPQKVADFRRLLEDPKIDAVVNATPDHWHAMITVMALDAGKHVYLEKPASHNIKDGKAIVAAQEKHPKLTVAIGTQQRSGQHFLDAKEFIDSGGLGKIGFLRASRIANRELVPIVPDAAPPSELDYEMWLGPSPHHPYNKSRVHYNWHFMWDTGTGELGNWGAHWIDVLLWFADLELPNAVAGTGGKFVTNDAKETPDTQTVHYRFDDLTLLWEQRLWSKFGAGGGMSNGCELDGEKGSMLIDRGGWKFFPRDGDAVFHKGTELQKAHVRNFAEAVRGHARPAASAWDGHKCATLSHLGNIATRLNRGFAFDPAAQEILGDEEASAWEGREYRTPWRLEDYV